MSACGLRLTVVLVVLVALLPSPAAASRDAGVAALQVALRARGLYAGSIDGLKGPLTSAATKRFQRRAGLAPSGFTGTNTRKALGRYGRHVLGGRLLARGARGWDVAALQFLLAWHGFPSATIDGVLGSHTDRALRRFQRWAGLSVDGVAGLSTVAALRRAPPTCPIALAWPVEAPLGNGFGPRGNHFHAGIDLLAKAGTRVGAAAPGRVAYAGRIDGGWGKLVVVAHARRVRTMYAHLSTVAVDVGERVTTGTRVG
ncbi:MAG TPA: peptidoglycan-binding protein, partial [Gaiellaceae bacterium]|nr:peptidoglycan-binding protein [Gaiellaceae bacterium]